MPEPLAITTPRIRLNGSEDARFSDATLELSIVQPADGRDIAELRLVDLGEHGEGPQREFTDLRLADRIEITVGDPDSPVLFSGQVVAIEERYGDGAPQLVLIAHDALQALAAHRRSQAWEDQAPAAVVRSLGSDAGLECDVQLPEVTATWHQLNESDLAFLRRLAGTYAAMVRIVDGKLSVRSPDASAQPALELSVGDAVRRLRVAADLARQPTRMTVAGINPQTGEAITAEATALAPAPAGDSGATSAMAAGWSEEGFLGGPAALSQGDANARVKAAFGRLAGAFLRGEADCRGDARLVTGSLLGLGGCSPRFAGNWLITHAAHHFDRVQGYRTLVQLARGGWQP